MLLDLSNGVLLAGTEQLGDDVNDLEMIREAGLGIAMAGAPEAVCNVADRMAPGNDADGVADVVNQLLDNRGT